MSHLLDGLPRDKMTREQENQHAFTLARYKTGAHREAAIEALVLGHMRDAFFYARRCCRAQFPDDDIYSFVYRALSRSVLNFQPDRQRFFAYSKPYIRGQIFREWRKLDVVKHSSLHELPGVGDEDEDLDSSEETTPPEFGGIDVREKMKIIGPLLGRLNAREREVLVLHYDKGLNFAEIAIRRGVSRAAIHSTHSRALRRVRNWLLGTHQLLDL